MKFNVKQTITKPMTFSEVVRFERINVHIPNGKDIGVDADGNVIVGARQYFGAVWFTDDAGQKFVSFVKKSTKLWQTMRVAEVGTVFTVKGKFKEHRVDEKHGDRIVITHVAVA